MKNEYRRHSVDFLFVLLIFAAFILTALLLITMGTSEYRRIVTRSGENDNIRITSSYLQQKIRQGRAVDAVSIGSIDGEEALAIRQDIAGNSYVTYLYVYQGQLRELMTKEGNTDVIAASGTAILPMQSIRFEIPSDDVICARLQCEDGTEQTVILPLLR